MSFWDITWFIIVAYVFFAYLMVLFSVIADIFRNRERETSGFIKAVWILLLIVLPILTVLVYLIANGASMNEGAARVPPAKLMPCRLNRSRTSRTWQTRARPPIRSPRRSGAISQAEYESMKAKALS